MGGLRLAQGRMVLARDREQRRELHSGPNATSQRRKESCALRFLSHPAKELRRMEVEGKLLQESLSTVKVQLIALRRCLVRAIPSPLVVPRSLFRFPGLGPAHGRAQVRLHHARRAQNVLPLPEAVLRTLSVSPLALSFPRLPCCTAPPRHGCIRRPPPSLVLPLRRSRFLKTSSRRSLRARPVRRQHRPSSLCVASRYRTPSHAHSSRIPQIS